MTSNIICQFSSGQPFPGDSPRGDSSQACAGSASGTKVILQSSSKYIQEIRQRLQENAVACEQREKRRNRFVVEQLRAHEAQEVRNVYISNVYAAYKEININLKYVRNNSV